MTKKFRIWGQNGHRQRASFFKSMTYTTSTGATVEELNSDKTGTNDYTELVITAKDENAIRDAVAVALLDATFESCRIGRIEEKTADGWQDYYTTIR